MKLTYDIKYAPKCTIHFHFFLLKIPLHTHLLKELQGSIKQITYIEEIQANHIQSDSIVYGSQITCGEYMLCDSTKHCLPFQSLLEFGSD